MTVVPGKIIILLRKEKPDTYAPRGAIALDTNEDSLDGVIAETETLQPLRLPLGGVRRIQETHFRRRRRLSRKKSGDRRIGGRLLRREGLRERSRVIQRLHRVSKGLVQLARENQAVIVLENIHLRGFRGHS